MPVSIDGETGTHQAAGFVRCCLGLLVPCDSTLPWLVQTNESGEDARGCTTGSEHCVLTYDSTLSSLLLSVIKQSKPHISELPPGSFALHTCTLTAHLVNTCGANHAHV